MRTRELDHPVGGELNAAIAREIVRVHSRCVGRGPTRAKAFHRDNLVVLLIEDALTPGERNLVDHGRAEAALEVRRQLHRSMRGELVETVETLTGRQVVAFLCDSEVEPDVSTQMFVLDRSVSTSTSWPNGNLAAQPRH